MKKPLNTRIITRAATVVTCAVCAVGLMTGCSQGSKADSASGASASATSADDYLLKMAKCMRDKGIDVSDPDSNGNMQFPDTEAANKAAQECEQTVGPAPGTEDLAKPETQQDLVKAAECLRKEGYDVPDPSAGQGIQLNGNIPQATMQKRFSSLNGGK